MSVITINLTNKKFDLACDPANHDRLLQLASTLDNDIKQIMESGSHVSFELALVMVSLQLMDFKDSGIKMSGGEAVDKVQSENQGNLLEIFNVLNKIIEK